MKLCNDELHKHSFCSMLFQEHGDHPRGSAGSHAAFLFVEVPLPWANEVQYSDSFPPGLAALLNRCEDQGISFRFQGFASDSIPSPSGSVRLFYFSRPDLSHEPSHHPSHYDKLEYLIPTEQLNAVVESVLTKGQELSRWDQYRQPSENIREIFVCTHGAHDLCCGKFGYPTYLRLDELAHSGQIRAWRTSHIGGHRYAPTLIDMPEGRYWARVTPDILPSLMNRQESLTEMGRHYRGWSMLNPFEQVAEHQLFTRYGWEWIHYHIKSECKMIDESSAIVTITYASPDRMIQDVYETEVYIAGTITLGGCGKDPVQAKQYQLRPAQPSRISTG